MTVVVGPEYRSFALLFLDFPKWRLIFYRMMVGWLDVCRDCIAHSFPFEFEQTLGDNEGQGRMVCFSPSSCKELDTTDD